MNLLSRAVEQRKRQGETAAYSRGTGSSNPFPSSGESDANLTFRRIPDAAYCDSISAALEPATVLLV
jgi:hypothetical protein